MWYIPLPLFYRWANWGTDRLNILMHTWSMWLVTVHESSPRKLSNQEHTNLTTCSWKQEEISTRDWYVMVDTHLFHLLPCISVQHLVTKDQHFSDNMAPKISQLLYLRPAFRATPCHPTIVQFPGPFSKLKVVQTSLSNPSHPTTILRPVLLSTSSQQTQMN